METRTTISGIDRVLKGLVNPSGESFAVHLERAQGIVAAATERPSPGAPSDEILRRAAFFDKSLRTQAQRTSRANKPTTPATTVRPMYFA